MDSEVVKMHKNVGWCPKKYEASIKVTISGSTQLAQFESPEMEFYFHSFAPKEWVLRLRADEGVVTVEAARRHETDVIIIEGGPTVKLPSSTINKDIAKGISKGNWSVLNEERRQTDLLEFPLPKGDEEFEVTFRVVYTVHVGVEDVTYCQLPASHQLATKVATAYEDLFHNGVASDVSFIVGDEEIKAHVAILASRAPYFERMMSSGVVESQTTETKKIEIKDADPATFKQVLRYIYCGKLPDDLQTSKVLPLADKYDLSDLRDACFHWLEKNLSKENVCDTLITADLYRCPNLKKKCLESLSQWKSSIEEEIKSVLLSHPNLLLELLNIV